MSAPAGWYTDPQVPQQLRYFDGSAWTTHTQPAPADAGAGAQQGQQGGFGQQTQQTQQGGFGHQAQQGGFQAGSFQQPAQYQQGRASRFGASTVGASQQAHGGYPGQPGTPGEEQPSGTPKVVKYGILGALGGILVLTIAALALGGGPEPDAVSDDAAEWVDEDFDCDALSEEVIDILAEDAADVRLESVSDLVEVENNIATVEVPSRGEATILACNATGVLGDGSSAEIRLEIFLDDSGQGRIGYLER